MVLVFLSCVYICIDIPCTYIYIYIQVFHFTRLHHAIVVRHNGSKLALCPIATCKVTNNFDIAKQN